MAAGTTGYQWTFGVHRRSYPRTAGRSHQIFCPGWTQKRRDNYWDFRQGKRWPFYINLQPFELKRIFRIKRNCPTIFFVLYNPVLYGWIFLCLDFAQRTTGIYSKLMVAKNKRYYKSFNIVNWIIYKKWLFSFFFGCNLLVVCYVRIAYYGGLLSFLVVRGYLTTVIFQQNASKPTK